MEKVKEWTHRGIRKRGRVFFVFCREEGKKRQSSRGSTAGKVRKVKKTKK